VLLESESYQSCSERKLMSHLFWIQCFYSLFICLIYLSCLHLYIYNIASCLFLCLKRVVMSGVLCSVLVVG